MANIKGNSEIPDRVRIKTELTAARVNAYYSVLNMTQETWIKNFTPAERYELAMADLLDKLQAGKIALGEATNIEIPE
jgi:hypothetical protein